MTDFERLAALPDHIQESAKARLVAIDQLRLGQENFDEDPDAVEAMAAAMSDRTLGSNGHADWERTWHALIEHALWTDDIDRDLFQFDPAEVPEFVLENLREAIDDSLFADFESVPSSARMAIRETMLDSLEARHGWSIRSISNNLQDAVAGLSQDEAETIARTETASLVNTARENGYRERLDVEEDQFKWQGPQSERTTEACTWLKEQTNPDFGGDPVSLPRLKELVQEAPSHDPDLPDDMAREWVVHPNERHTYVRVVDS